MRTITNTITDTGLEPVNEIEIFWSDTSTIYSDTDKILSLSNLDEIITVSRNSNSAAISVRLDDSDGSIKALMDQFDMHKRPCIVRQGFEGQSDQFVLLKGEISSPIVWDADNREVSFDVISVIETIEVGFSPEEGQFSFIPDDLTGRMWPLCFGSPIHVPAVKSKQVVSGTLLTQAGFPDATFSVKLEYLNLFRIELLKAYYFYVSVIAQASANSPSEIRDGFIQAIIDEDTNKQEREDLTTAIDELNNEIDQLSVLYVSERTPSVKERLDELVLLRDEKRDDELEPVLTALSNLEFAKQKYEVEGDYAKYLVDLIEELRSAAVEIVQEIIETDQNIVDLVKAKAQQDALYTSSIVVQSGEDFTQDEIVTVNLNGLLLRGFFTSNVFTLQTVIPSYSNFQVQPVSGTQNQFTVPSGTILDNMYCYLPSGHTIKISGQTGNTCTFDLIGKPEREGKEPTLIINGENADQIKSALSDILTGTETYAQIQNILNFMPKELSTVAYESLAGQNTKQRVKYYPKEDSNNNGTFTLTYDGFETNPISVNDSALLAFDAFVNLSIFKHLQPTSDFFTATVYDEDGLVISDGKFSDNCELEITFDLEDQPSIDGYYFDYAGTGSIVLAFIHSSSGRVFEINVRGEELEDDLDGYMTRQDDNVWLLDEDYTHVYLNTNTSNQSLIRLFKIRSLTNTMSTLLVEDQPSEGWVYTYRPSTGAHEYTIKEIEALIDKDINEHQNGQQLGRLKKELELVQNLLIDSKGTAEFPVNQIKFDRKFSEYSDLYTKVISTGGSEVDKLISDEEYRFLFDMELLNYIKAIRALVPISIEDTTEYFVTNTFTEIKEAAPAILSNWIGNVSIPYVQSLPQSGSFVGNIGDELTLEADFQDQYVANMLPSDDVHGVFGVRLIDGVERFVPIPSSYYAVTNGSFGPLTPTVVSFVKPLTSRRGDWKDEVYTTVTSSIGPNVVDIITYLLTYTNITKDATTFAAVHTKQVNYPANFALLQKRDALELIKDIAYQARCAVWVSQGVMYIRYLSEEGTAITTIDESDIVNRTLKMSHTETEAIYTKLTNTWRANYFIDPYKLVLRSNIGKYGEIPSEYDFFIYNDRNLVYKSASFWLIRDSNTWKRAEFSTFLNKLQVETLDVVTIALSDNPFSNSNCDGLVEKADYNSDTNTITMSVWLPVRSGEMVKYSFAYPATTNDIYPTTDLVVGGNVGSPTNIQVPTGQDWDLLDDLNIRPLDFSKLERDDADTLPQNPATELTQIEYDAVEFADSLVITPKPITQVGGKGVGGLTRPAAFKNPEVGWGKIKSNEVKQLDGTDYVELTVVLDSGRKVKVRALGIDPASVVPTGIWVQVFWSTEHGGYRTAPPTWGIAYE